jgi:hypothetical protein
MVPKRIEIANTSLVPLLLVILWIDQRKTHSRINCVMCEGLT